MALPTASDNPFPSILITEGTEPSAPAAGKQRLYIDSTTHHLKRTDSSGTDVDIESAAANGLATDTLWDAAGDLVVGSGANTAAKLTKGSAGGYLSMINGAVAWNSGTSFPGSAVAGDRYWRTDLNLEFFYNGTRWLTITQYRLITGAFHPGSTTTNVTATTTPYERVAVPYLGSCSDVWIETWVLNFYVYSGATALGASHNWVASLNGSRDNTNGTLDAITSVTVNSGSSAVIRRSAAAVGALMDNGTAHDWFVVNVTKTGTPGNWESYSEILYRMVAT